MRNDQNRNRRRSKGAPSTSRWAAYAAAGAATALGSAELAEAGITYHGPLNAYLDASTNTYTQYRTHLVDVNNDGVDDVQFLHVGALSYGAPIGAAYAFGMGGAEIAGFLDGRYPYAYNLALTPYRSEAVNARDFQTAGTMAFTSGFTYSQFLDQGKAFIGFSFDAGEGTQYGWLQVEMTGAPHNALTILDWAYAGVGEEILPGQVPEPGSLGLLATGALGLLLWRRTRRKNHSAA